MQQPRLSSSAVANALMYVHLGTDTERQWQRAVSGLIELDYLERALVWKDLASRIEHENQDIVPSKTTHSQLKVLFEQALKQADIKEYAPVDTQLCLSQKLEDMVEQLDDHMRLLMLRTENPDDPARTADRLGTLLVSSLKRGNTFQDKDILQDLIARLKILEQNEVQAKRESDEYDETAPEGADN